MDTLEISDKLKKANRKVTNAIELNIIIKILMNSFRSIYTTTGLATEPLKHEI